MFLKRQLGRFVGGEPETILKSGGFKVAIRATAFNSGDTLDLAWSSAREDINHTSIVSK